MYIFKFEYGSQSPPNFCDFVFANYAIMRVKNMNPLHYVNHQDMCEKSTKGRNKNIATGETSQVITPFHLFDYFKFYH